MTDYISREAVLREIRECFNNNGWYGNSRVELLNAIASLPGREDKDGERYRYLRSSPMKRGFTMVDVQLLHENEDGPTGDWYSYDGEELDAAIDAAMQAEEGK